MNLTRFDQGISSKERPVTLAVRRDKIPCHQHFYHVKPVEGENPQRSASRFREATTIRRKDAHFFRNLEAKVQTPKRANGTRSGLHETTKNTLLEAHHAV